MVQSPTAEQTSTPTRGRFGVPRKHRLAALLFVLPAVVILLAITIYPLLRTLYLTVMSLELAVSPVARFVGIDNFIRALAGDARFWGSLGNTGILVVGGVVAQLLLGTLLALILNDMRRGRTVVLSLLLLPVMIAPVVAGFQFRVIFNDTFGPLNFLIGWLSGGRLSGPLWLADPDMALFSIMLADTWQWTPFMVLLLLAGLQSVPPQLTEAAEVDGAGYWQIFWRVKLPSMLPIVAIAVLIRAMDAFNKSTFDLVYLLTGGGPGSATETAAYYTYLNGFKFFSMGYTATLAVIQLIVIVVIATLFLQVLQRQRGGS
jgi:multiple sugar transport system permease protein